MSPYTHSEADTARWEAAHTDRPDPDMTRNEAERDQTDTYFDLVDARPYRPAPGRQLRSAA